MAMTRPIPQAIRDKFSADPFYKVCCIKDDECSLGKVEWHHNFTYGGRRTDDEESILPACVYHHSKADTTKIKERFDWVMLSRGGLELDAKYPKANLRQRYDYLETIYAHHTT